MVLLNLACCKADLAEEEYGWIYVMCVCFHAPLLIRVIRLLSSFGHIVYLSQLKEKLLGLKPCKKGCISMKNISASEQVKNNCVDLS